MRLSTIAIAAALAAFASQSAAVAPGSKDALPLDTAALPDIGEEWLAENPWRDPASEEWSIAVRIGDSGFNQNCARCHGLGAVSGGLAPDLRYLEADDYGDEWYLERYRHGYTQNGVTKMPGFGELLGQKAAWAIRTYIETRPDDGEVDEITPRLRELREEIARMAEEIAGGASAAEYAEPIEAVRAEMLEMAAGIETASGAKVADSVASRAADDLGPDLAALRSAVETLTVGLSAAK